MLHEVITAEKVPLVFKVAGLGSRFLAWLLDLCLIVFLILGGRHLGQVYELAREGVGFAVAMVGTFVIQWGYFLLFEWLWHGQTPASASSASASSTRRAPASPSARPPSATSCAWPTGCRSSSPTWCR